MDVTLDAVRREGAGKNAARRLRRGGRVPGVLYGGAPKEGEAPQAIPISVDPKAVLRILHSESGANTLIGLTLGGESSRVMIKQYQLDPVTHAVLHADFYRVAMDRTLTVKIPIVIRGEARGVKQQGGLLDFVHREIEIESLPGDIPEHLEVEVSELALGQGIRLRDVATNVTWTPVTDPDVLLVHVVAPRAVEEPAPAEAAAAAAVAPAEPEVIKKGKVEKPEEEEEKEKK
jgi:large subunit ribosomal protein L25